MKPFFHALLSWWYTRMIPVLTTMRTLTEREYERKRRLLASLLLFETLLALLFSLLGTIISPTEGTPIGWLAVVMLLIAFLLNRKGYLKCATLLLLFATGGGLFFAAILQAQTDVISLLWTLIPIVITLGLAGLFLSTRLILLLAVGESGLLFWYVLVQQHEQITHMLVSENVISFLIYLLLMVCANALIGISYTLSLKKAVIQADRATELELAHQELSRAYTRLEEAHLHLEEAHATIQKQALTDGLTGLANHRAMVDQLSRELDRARRTGRTFSVIFFDADHFKHVNDTHGHAAGDAVLCEIGRRARSVLREEDTLGRFGGEEFVLFLPEADASEASRIAERIRLAIAASPISASEVAQGIPMTVSIGVATFPQDAETEQELLTHADAAMYMAKRLGRNQVRTAEEARQMSADVDALTLL